MRVVLIASLLVIACGGATPAAPQPARAEREAPTSRDDLIAATLAATSLRDSAALDRLHHGALDDRAFECTSAAWRARAREIFQTREARMLDKLGGARLELVGIDNDRTQLRLAPGGRFGSCTAKLGVETHAIDLVVKVGVREERVLLHALRV